MPGLTAEASLYRTSKQYSTLSLDFAGAGSGAAVVPAYLLGQRLAQSPGNPSPAGPVCPTGTICCEYDPESRTCIGGCCDKAAHCCPGGTAGIGSGNTCADVLSDPANCGSCGRACPTGQRCSGGVCVSTCPPGQTLCGNACVDTSRDPANCGACGTNCATQPGGPYQACCPGPDGLGHCMNVSNNNSNCGACGNACPPGRFCAGSYCVCEGSGRLCHGGQCQNGNCVCPTGLTYCPASDTCQDLSNDPNNCGSCGNACPPGQPCVRGACAPPPPSCSGWCGIAYGLCAVPCTLDLLTGKDWSICICDCLSSSFGSPGCCIPCGV